MDVYQKILLKVYEITGGKDTIDVDLADLVKKEGFYPSLPSISAQLISQSWVTETSRKNVVRLTHWGTREAKKIQTSSPENAQNSKKEINRLLSEAREFVSLLQDFSLDQTNESFSKVENKIFEINAAIANIKSNIQ